MVLVRSYLHPLFGNEEAGNKELQLIHGKPRVWAGPFALCVGPSWQEVLPHGPTGMGSAEAELCRPGIDLLSLHSAVAGVAKLLYPPSPSSGMWIIYQVPVAIWSKKHRLGFSSKVSTRAHILSHWLNVNGRLVAKQVFKSGTRCQLKKKPSYYMSPLMWNAQNGQIYRDRK